MRSWFFVLFAFLFYFYFGALLHKRRRGDAAPAKGERGGENEGRWMAKG